MRISEINSSSSRLTESKKFSDEPGLVKDGAGRALTVIEPPQAAPPASRFRQAPFLAQLIATKDRHPQTRDRRRAEPAEAIDAYRAAKAMMESDED